MKQKLFAFFFAMVASVGTMFATSGTCGDNLTWDLTDSVLTISGTGYMYNYSYKEGNYITTAPWGLYFTSMTSVVINTGVTSIGKNAFYGCYNLTSVTISNSVTSIGEQAFYNCSSLTSVTIPNSVTSIGDYAFFNCTHLTSPIFNAHFFVRLPMSYSGAYTIPDGIETIKNYAFSDCSGLTSIEIPNSVTNIGSGAFRDCSGLTSIEIPNSVTSIGSGAFRDCSGLTSVIWNAKNCANSGGFESQIEVFTFGNEVESIPAKCCSGMNKLTSIAIPNSVTSIGKSAFSACTGLASLAIPNSVTSIGEGAFYKCSGLKSPVYNAHIFAYLPTSYMGGYTIPDGIESIADKAIYQCYDLTSVIIPNSVTSIGNFAISNCSGLTSVTIGNSVTSIGNCAFSFIGLTSVNIPNSVTSIGEGAFSGCSGLTSVTIGNRVTSIKSGTFANCKGLTSIKIPNSVASIGYRAFYYCTGLENVVLGSSVRILEEEAFVGCSSIKTITCYTQRPPTVSEYALKDLDYSTIVYVPADYLDTYKLHDAWGLYDVRPLGAEKTETDKVSVTPAENTVDVTWPTVTGAATYELIIRDKNGNVICTLIFNAQGQLTSIAFAPSINAPQHTQTAGFAFTITGLEDGTYYSYSITAKNESGTILNVEEGTFRTQSLEAVDEVLDGQSRGIKFLRDGQILIQKGDKTFDLRGQEVR